MDTTRASLLVRVRDPQNSQAWRQFDAIYRPMLYRFARARGLDHADAEDIVQQCMGAVQKYIREFDYDPARGRFKGWLRTMLNNRVRNLAKARHEQVAESQDFKRPQHREESPDETFERLWMQEHLRHCLRELESEVESSTFQAYQAYVIEERPVEEVCRELNMTANQLYKIKWRVTQRLGEKMKLLTEGME